MKIKLDHNLSRHLRISLEAFGHDVDTAFDEGWRDRQIEKSFMKRQRKIEFSLR